MRALVLASMPEGATPESHIASGPWCFAGREQAFPGWDDAGDGTRYFPLPPDPYPDAEAMLSAARAANGEALRLARIFGASLFSRHGNAAPPSDRFSLMALGPFLLLATHMLAERQQRALRLVELYGHQPLRVELLPGNTPFSFSGSLDFMLHGVQDVNFNHYVYSRILESVAPPAWQLAYTACACLHTAANAPAQSLAARVRGYVRKKARDLPFPRCKGFSPLQVLALSLAVLANRREHPDQSLDFSLFCGEPVTWRFPAQALVKACLPLALRDAKPPAPARPCAGTGPLRGMSPAYTQDDAYRLRLASLRERGCRLFCVQHGANYGNLKSVGGLPFEYGQHVFFTWGWQKHSGVPANAVPLPHPALCRIANAHNEKEPCLILVGTEMSTFSYRLKSRPQAAALPAYRRGKIRFLKLLREYLRESRESSAAPGGELLYRPYFKVAGGLDDADYVRRHLPDIRICTGDLTEQMLGARLLVLDHYGTTLHMALAANVPCLAFWKSAEWAMEEQSEETLDLLRAAGIVHETPESAARAAMRVWDDTRAWWQSAEIQRARLRWLDCYATIGDTVPQPLGMFRLTRRWFRTLRNC